MLGRPGGFGRWPRRAGRGRPRSRGCMSCCCASPAERSPAAARGWRSPVPSWRIWPTRRPPTRWWRLLPRSVSSGARAVHHLGIQIRDLGGVGEDRASLLASPIGAAGRGRLDRAAGRFGFDPAQEAEWRDLLAALRRAVDAELTPRQREVFVAIVLNGVPLDALVLSLGSSRNAIYKMLFDARRKLRAALAANGYIGHDTAGRS